MLKSIYLILIFVVCYSSHATVTKKQLDNATWEEMTNEDGIKVFTADIPGSDIVAFRANTIIKTPVKDIVHLLGDISRKHLWVAKLIDIHSVEYKSRKHRVEYYKIKTPWFLSNRDFVYEAKLKELPGKAIITLNSTTHPKEPVNEGVVRAKLIYGEYIISARDKNTSDFQVTMMADPMGSIPKWVVNLYQKSWPYKTIMNIKKVIEPAKLRQGN